MTESGSLPMYSEAKYSSVLSTYSGLRSLKTKGWDELHEIKCHIKRNFYILSYCMGIITHTPTCPSICDPSLPNQLPFHHHPRLSYPYSSPTSRTTTENDRVERNQRGKTTTISHARPRPKSQSKLVFPLSLRSIQRNLLCLVFSKSDAACFSLIKHAFRNE